MRNHSLTTLSRPLLGLVFTVLIALAPTGCRKEPGPPSEAYELAQKRFSKLYAQQLDGAFSDPQMEEIEALLEQVPPDSVDASSTRELQERIKAGKAKMEKARKEQEDAIASARQVDSVGPSTPIPSEPEPEPTQAPTARDAGPGTGGPEVGTEASELSAGYLGCFQRMKQITVTGRGLRDAWEMADRARCSQSYPGFVAKVVILEDGKVFAVLPKSAVKITFETKDGGSTTGGPGSGP